MSAQQVVDARGRRCPLPIIDLARAARSAPVGSLIILLANDPAATADVAAWCRMRGQDFEGSQAMADGESGGGGGEGDGDGEGDIAYRVRIRVA